MSIRLDPFAHVRAGLGKYGLIDKQPRSGTSQKLAARTTENRRLFGQIHDTLDVKELSDEELRARIAYSEELIARLEVELAHRRSNGRGWSRA